MSSEIESVIDKAWDERNSIGPNTRCDTDRSHSANLGATTSPVVLLREAIQEP